MPEIEEDCIFEVAPGNVSLQTQANGDKVTIAGLHFTAEQAATFAWLLNNPDITTLEISIKEKT